MGFYGQGGGGEEDEDAAEDAEGVVGLDGVLLGDLGRLVDAQ